MKLSRLLLGSPFGNDFPLEVLEVSGVHTAPAGAVTCLGIHVLMAFSVVPVLQEVIPILPLPESQIWLKIQETGSVIFSARLFICLLEFY